MNLLQNDVTGYARRANFYRVEYNEKRDIPFFLSFIDQNKTKVLEVPCGAGRLTIDLARKAKHVTAVDIEPFMITSLNALIKSEGLNNKITARLGDMTDLSLDENVDLIIVPSEALQLLPHPEGKKALSCLAGLLNPHGKMIVDIATFSEHQAGQLDYCDPATIGLQWHLQWVRNLPNGGNLSREVRIERQNAFLRFEFRYNFTEFDKPSINFTDEMILYYYSLEWLTNNVPDFVSLVSVLGSHHGEPVNKNSSRIIAVLQR